MIENIETLSKSIKWVYEIVHFLFFSVAGWIFIGIILFFIILLNSKNEKGYFSIGKFIATGIERVFFLLSNIFQIIVGVIIVLSIISFMPVIKEAKDVITLYRDVSNLKSALKNLKSERKIVEAIVTQSEDKNELIVNLKYFSYSPVKNTDILTGEKEYRIPGNKVYLDSIVINFDYTLIESGKSINIALPYKIFSDVVSFEDGISINARDGEIPFSLKLDEGDIYLLSKNEYNSVIKTLINTLEDKRKAQKMGIKTFYSEAVVLLPSRTKKYTIYSTGTGGLILR